MQSIVEQYKIFGGTAREISASIESAVIAGDLPPGSTLPSVRLLATELGVSPATVASAYKELRSRGIVKGHSRSRTSVSLRPPLGSQPEASVPAGVRDLATGNPDPRLLPELTDLGAVPSTRISPPRLYRERLILSELEAAIPMRLTAAGLDGRCDFTVVGGAMDGIERVLGTHLRAGDRVAVEDPGYANILDLLPAMGFELCPLRMDAEGIRPESLEEALRGGISALIATPRAQNPTGALISASRASELRSLLACYPEILLIEDDHLGLSSDVSYNTLIDSTRTHWAFIHSVSKFLGPDLRLAVLAGDSLTINRVEGRLSLGYGWISSILQETVARLWGDHSTMELIGEASRIYSLRRETLLETLAENGIEGAAGPSGLNVWIPVPKENAVVTGLFTKGWAVRPGEAYRIDAPPAIRVTTASLKPDEARRFATDFLSIARTMNRTRTA